LSDLPHTYTSDIQFQETEVFSADTEYIAQRMGQNTNYLLDVFPPIASQLATIQATAAKFDIFTASGNYGVGVHTLFVGTGPMAFAILYPQSVYSNPTAGSTTSAGFSLAAQNTVPLLCSRTDNGYIKNPFYLSPYYSAAKFQITPDGVYNTVQVTIGSGGQPLVIYG